LNSDRQAEDRFIGSDYHITVSRKTKTDHIITSREKFRPVSGG
jgi:hypothetical protein